MAAARAPVRDGFLVGRWARVQGLAMHARVGRPFHDAPPVVLLHGLGVSSRSLEPTAAVLAREFAVYVPDLPGSGRSEHPRRALDFGGLAAALSEWLDAMRLERASFVATSMGCQVIAALAQRNPRRVGQLVLVGPTVDPQWRSMTGQIPRWMLETVREPRSLLPIVLGDYIGFGPRLFARTARFALEDRIERRLPRIESPTLVVRGQRDAFVSQAWAEEVTDLLPSGRLAVLPDVAHAAYYSAPARLASLVSPFLRVA